MGSHIRMKFSRAFAFLLGVVSILNQTDARRIQIQRPLPQEEYEQETVNYYAAEPQGDQGTVILVSAADRYNGPYGQQSATARRLESNNIPRTPAKIQESRTKEAPRAPPVQTIRNYNKVNDDGSFTFGYEAADGSFKEETRGTDCVVRGKYGYVDPDGNKREFTYVSGNPCDPNSPKDEEESEESNETENDHIPANYPTRPILPVSNTVASKRPVTLFHNTYTQEREQQPESEQTLRPTPQAIRGSTYISRSQNVQQPSVGQDYQIPQTPQSLSTTTPTSIIYRSSDLPINITPRPISQSPPSRSPQLPATTYRPQSLQVSVTPRPTSLYTKQLQTPISSSIGLPTKHLGFEREFQRFQQENNIISSTSNPAVAKSTPDQVYSTALVYDPTTGQDNTKFHRFLSQSDEDYVLKQKIQPYSQRQHTVSNIQQFQQNLLQHPVTSQAAYQAQQAELQFQNSAQLYAQQQRMRAEQEQQRHLARQQPVYYIQPSVHNAGALASSQIDAFLKGHNIQF